MPVERNTIPPQKASGPAAAYLAAGPGASLAALPLNGGGWAGVALNREEIDDAATAMCFAGVPADKADWVELIPAGRFEGRDGRAWTNGKPADVVALSMKAAVNGQICVDLDHQLQLSANKDVGGTAPAAGWIGALEVRGGAIWGRVDWTELGANAVDKKLYRGLSPVFAHDKAGNVLALLSVALTNKPNLALAAFNHRQNQSENSMNWLTKLLGLPDDATQETITAALNALLGVIGALGGLLGVDRTALVAMNAEALRAALDRKLGSDVAVALCAEAGVQVGTAAPAIVAAIRDKGVDLAKFVPMETFASINAQLKELQKASVDALIEGALESGKLVPAEKDWAVALAAQNLKALQDYIGVAPVKVPNGEVKKPADKEAGEANDWGLTDAEKAMCAATGQPFKQFHDSKVEIAARAA